jgi:chromosome partitioning protein
MKTVAVINQKGGVGKTAIAYNIAEYLASQATPTLLVDLDPSANATRGLDFPYHNEYVGDIFTKSHLKTFQPETCSYEIDTNLWLMPSRIHLALVQRQLACRTYRESVLKKQLDKFALDYCIIDCSPTLSDLTINAIYAADLIVIPVTYEDDALEGLADLFSVIDEIKENQTFEWRIVRSQKDIRKRRTNEYIERKLEDFATSGNLFNTIIRQDEAINHAKIERKTIFSYAPTSNGATDLKALTEEIKLCLN